MGGEGEGKVNVNVESEVEAWKVNMVVNVEGECNIVEKSNTHKKKNGSYTTQCT